jgi:hypothetical protein
MLRSLTLPDGNFVKPGTILGDVLEYNSARSTMTSKLAQANEPPPETTKGDGMYKKERFFLKHFIDK